MIQRLACLLALCLISLAGVGCAAGSSANGGGPGNGGTTGQGCSAPRTQCGAACVDTTSDPANCGACGQSCSAGSFCSAGTCSCGAGSTNCSGACVNTTSDSSHCGSCTTACVTGQTCSASVCTCISGLMACGTSCVDVQSDSANCGACGHGCATGEVCSAGACKTQCDGALTQCGQDCVDVQTSVANCGSCGHACAAGQGCSGGNCSCPSGQTLCGTTCTDTTTDPQNCGACGTACTGGRVCGTSGCTCPNSGTFCSGACANTQTDPNNCGACGTACGTGANCVNGGCQGGTGGTGGSGGTGGATGGTGGTTGGTGGSGGTGGTAGSCGRAVGSCTAPAVQVTDVSLGVPITAYGNEGDTNPLPMAIAARPSGGSLLAVLSTDGNVYVATLGCDDHLVGTPFKFPATDLQDLYADDNGGVVLLTRHATQTGTDNCGNGMLCGGTSSQCSAMFMVRFDNSGTVQWTTQVTNLSDTVPGYTNGARFIWWYQHHGRLAFDGQNYAAYHGVAITVNNGACVDIHEGDRMQVVSSSGQLLTGHDSFAVGCSHSWTTRIVWDPRTSHFVMVCATDNNCRIAQPNPYRTVAAGTCDGTLFGGDLVLASTAGYWTAWSQGGNIRLEHFTTGASDQTVNNAGASQHPHLVSYGTGRMLLTWGSGTSMAAQVRDAGTGATIGAQFTISVNDHNYQAFKAYADGSVAYPASGANNTSVKIARVMPCN